MSSNEQLKAQLTSLTQAFKKRVAGELDDLLALSQQIPTNPGEADVALIELRDRLHKLAGSAGTFGFHQLGEQAKQLEILVKANIEHRRLDAASHQRLLDGIKGLPEYLRAAQPVIINQSIPLPSEAAPQAQRIAIVEPDPQLLDNICQTLVSFGYLTSGFADLAALQRGFKDCAPNALIVDLATSDSGEGSNSLAVIAALQASLSEPVPLIVISDQDDFSAQAQAVRAGAQGFFIRPLDLPALENRLEGCLNRQVSEPFRVLIIDDDLQLAERFHAVLSNAGMLVDVLCEASSLLQKMQSFMPDVVLMDVNMPEYTGPELAQIIRLNEDWLRIPIVYLSSETDAQRQMDALIKAGDDFITKPISDSALLTTVYSRAQRARRMSKALSRDSLTGLLKHADIKEQLEIESERALRTRLPVSVAMIDIDHFKSVNDMHGHAVGDNVIRGLANLLRQRLRKIDRLGRYGGEEFVAVLPNCNAENAMRVLDKIREDFFSLQFSGSQDLFHSSFSAGVSCCEAPLWQHDDLLEAADRALYRAKALGRNQIALHVASTEESDTDDQDPR